jgi:hypothetical protein
LLLHVRRSARFEPESEHDHAATPRPEDGPVNSVGRPPAARDDQLQATPQEPAAGLRRWPSRAVQLCWKGIVRLPGSQPLLLRQMERSLLAEDFRLDSGFAIFTRSACGQEMPATERVPAWPRSLWASGMTATGLAAASSAAAAGGAVILSWLIVNQRANPGGARPDVST